MTPKWSLLSVFGNTPLAKVVVLSPVIAQAVYHSKDWVELYIGLTSKYWLYWSLIIMGLAQLIYIVFCPVAVKKYGTDQEQYKIESLATMSNWTFDVLYSNYIFSHFEKSHGNVPPLQLNFCGYFELKEITDEELTERLQHARDEQKSKNQRWSELGRILYGNSNEKIVEIYNDFKKGATTGGYFHSSWSILHALLEFHPDLVFVNGETWRTLPLYDRVSEDSKSWKLSALDWAFHYENVSHTFLRWSVFVLYVVGFVYFINSALRNLSRMFFQTLAAIN